MNRANTITHPAAHRLVILGGTNTALAVARDARHSGLHCQVVDIDKSAIRYSNAVDEYVACESDQDVLAALDRVAGDYWLIADSDHWLRFIVENRASLHRATILHPADSTIETCLIKDRFSRWCQASGLSTPAIVDPQDAGKRFPVVVRPNLTRHRQVDVAKASVAWNQRELDACLAEFRRVQSAFVITEAVIDQSTRYFAVGLARRADGAMLGFATEKLRPPVERCRGASFVQTCSLPEAIALAKQVAERLDFVGVGELEIVHRGGTFSVVELNPRPWLQYGMARALGLSLLGFVALEQPQPAATGTASWISIATDAYWCLSRSGGLIWSGQLPLGKFLAQAFAADCRPMWDWRDPAPFLRSVLKLRHR